MAIRTTRDCPPWFPSGPWRPISGGPRGTPRERSPGGAGAVLSRVVAAPTLSKGSSERGPDPVQETHRESREAQTAAIPVNPEIQWRHSAGSNVGRVRRQNEDAFGADQPPGLFIVADGMGGHAAGEVASRLAVRCAAEGVALLPEDAPREEAAHVMRDAIRDANQVILIEGEAHPEKSGMGTTATALLLSRQGWWIVGHVGDSRAYLIRDGEATRITEDHTYVQELVNQGRLSAEEARTHPRSSLLTRALGTADRVPIDVYDGELRAGDRFVLASDGLMTMVPEQRIVALLEEPWSSEKLVDRLIAAANEAGGHDNTTALVVDIMAPTPE